MFTYRIRYLCQPCLPISASRAGASRVSPSRAGASCVSPSHAGASRFSLAQPCSHEPPRECLPSLALFCGILPSVGILFSLRYSTAFGSGLSSRRPSLFGIPRQPLVSACPLDTLRYSVFDGLQSSSLWYSTAFGIYLSACPLSTVRKVFLISQVCNSTLQTDRSISGVLTASHTPVLLSLCGVASLHTIMTRLRLVCMSWWGDASSV